MVQRPTGIIQNILFENLKLLGGVDAAGISKIVEIDETLFFKRKYNRGRHRSPQWVLEKLKEIPVSILVLVPDRRAETLYLSSESIFNQVHPLFQIVEVHIGGMVNRATIYTKRSTIAITLLILFRH